MFCARSTSKNAVAFETTVSYHTLFHLTLCVLPDVPVEICSLGVMRCSVTAFPEEDNECLVEDCTAWLMDIRASVTRNETSCPVPEYQLCEKFASQKSSRVKILPDVDWPASSHVTVKNILHVVDTQNWQNCVIVYDFKACKLIFYFILFIYSLYDFSFGLLS